MKRVLFFLLSLTLISFVFCGCGEKKVTDVDIDLLSSQLLESGGFSDILCPLTANIAAALYDIDENDFEDFALYCSTGASAEEIALFKAKDEGAALRIKDAVDARIQKQISSYGSYVPSEVPKLESAIVRQEGVFVIYITSNEPDKAKEIIDSYM